MNNDFPKAQAECRRIEKEWGLRQLNPGDRTAAKNPTSAERFKAERTGRPEAPRETLREAVRHAVAGASTETEFFTRLREKGVRVKLREAPSGDVIGYSVAMPGDRNRDGTPIWFPGSKLAPDLSLPKLRLRLADAPGEGAEPSGLGADRTGWSPPARARRTAAGDAENAIALLRAGDDEGAAQLVGLGELLDAAAQTSPAATRAELAAAARCFERATRSHTRARQADTRVLRSAARGIIQAGAALGQGEDGAATAMLLSTLVLATLAATYWHSARSHAQQAAAAHRTAEHLRTAYRQAAAAPMQTLHARGRALPEAQRRRYETTIRAALSGTACTTDRTSATDALAATLAEAEHAGHDPHTLLRKAIAMRELDTADDVNDVLVWRLRRLAHLPAHPRSPDRPPKADTRRNSADTGTAAVHSARPAPPDPRPSPPHR